MNSAERELAADGNMHGAPGLSEETMMGHKQVSIKHPSGRRIRVDEGMASLLQGLWALGIPTFHSCQGDPPEPVSIGFCGSIAVEAFLEYLSNHWTNDPDPLKAIVWRKRFERWEFFIPSRIRPTQYIWTVKIPRQDFRDLTELLGQ